MVGTPAKSGGINMHRVKSPGMADLTLQKFERCQEGWCRAASDKTVSIQMLW